MRRLMLLPVLLACLVPWGMPGFAAVAAAQSSRAAKALQLAELVTPSTELEMTMARDATVSALASDESFQAMEKENPGAVQALWDAMEPIMRADTEADRPRFLSRIAGIYEAKLSEQQIEAMMVFFRTPTGIKLIDGATQHLDLSAVTSEALSSDTEGVSREAYDAAVSSSKVGVAQAMTEADWPAMEQLFKSVPMQEFMAIGKDVQQATFEYVNEPDPELDAALAAAAEAAMLKHMGQ